MSWKGSHVELVDTADVGLEVEGETINPALSGSEAFKLESHASQEERNFLTKNG